MRKIALFLAIFISCFGYELGELKNIVKTDGVSGNFTQTKSLAGFNKSIKSSFWPLSALMRASLKKNLI